MREVKNSNIWLLIAAVLCLSVQIVAIVIYTYSFIPYPAIWSDPFFKGVEPDRDALFYMIFLAANMALVASGVKWVLPRLESPEFRRKFKLWLGLEFTWCFLIVFCFFKWTTYRYPFWNVLFYENQAWLQPFFCTVCGLALLSKVFFPEIDNFTRRLQAEAGKQSFLKRWIIPMQIIFIAGVALLLYIPSPENVTALALAWDQWNHLDRVAGWFIKHSWYINYEDTIRFLLLAAIAYLVGLFYFIRLWLNSWLLAAIGVLLTIKLGMFYYSTTPCVWINPSNTFLAHGWDIVLFFGLWFVSIKYPKNFYWAAALAGMALLVAWFKSNGYIEALGLDDQPMMAPLRVRQFFPFFMGYFVPVFYVFSLLWCIGRRGSPDTRLPAVICIYGLMIFVDYLERPMIGYYGSLMVPAILIMLWWFQQLSLSWTLFVRRGVLALILLLAAGALLTNRLMLTYPDIIFQDKERFAREKAFYGNFNAIAQSASLISQLTKEDQKVVLISNFETALLMQAHRCPLFKDFPVMFSGFDKGPGGLNLKTKDQCQALIKSMAAENALYVFVDIRLLAVPQQALGNSGMGEILAYLRDHYQVYTKQGFLVALQRR